MTSTGKAARKRHGNRFAAKAAKARTRVKRTFGKLPYSNARGNAVSFDSDGVMRRAAESYAWVAAGLARPRA